MRSTMPASLGGHGITEAKLATISPHAVQQYGELTGNGNDGFARADALDQRPSPAVQKARARRATEQDIRGLIATSVSMCRWSRPQFVCLMKQDRWFGGASVPRSRRALPPSTFGTLDHHTEHLEETTDRICQCHALSDQVCTRAEHRSQCVIVHVVAAAYPCTSSYRGRATLPAVSRSAITGCPDPHIVRPSRAAAVKDGPFWGRPEGVSLTVVSTTAGWSASGATFRP
jgi:hypothetical protein